MQQKLFQYYISYDLIRNGQLQKQTYKLGFAQT